jgi:hypothetical protein
MLRFTAICVLLVVLAGASPAAIVDVNVDQVEDTPISRLFQEFLDPDAAFQPGFIPPPPATGAAPAPAPTVAVAGGTVPTSPIDPSATGALPVDGNATAVAVVPVVDPAMSATEASTGAASEPAMAASGTAPATASGAAVVDDPSKPFNALLTLHRALVKWDGATNPPVIRLRGLDFADLIARLAKREGPLDNINGKTWPLPGFPGFGLVVIGGESVVIPLKAAAKIDLPAWPAQGPHALDAHAPSKDLKLYDLQQKITEFHLVYDQSGETLLNVSTPSDKTARSVDRYVWWRSPLVFAGADLGVKRLKFPARILNATTIQRTNNILSVSLNLAPELRDQAFDYLVDAMKRELHRYR